MLGEGVLATTGCQSERRPLFRFGARKTERERDLRRQLARVLETKRWQQRDGPFRGFSSPPGKF